MTHPGGNGPRIHGILETCLYVEDLDQAETFYRDLLGLEFVSRQAGRHVFFRCGQRMLLLFNPRASGDPASELPPHGARGPGHVAFAVPADQIDVWAERLAEANIPLERLVDWPGRGRSLYFRDPSDNSVEITTPKIWGLEDAVES